MHIFLLPQEGIRKLKDIEKLLKNGADKVVLNTVAIKDPKIINSAAKEFGSQCIVICIDVKSEDNNFYLMEEYGQKSSTNLIEYLKKFRTKILVKFFTICKSRWFSLGI